MLRRSIWKPLLEHGFNGFNGQKQIKKYLHLIRFNLFHELALVIVEPFLYLVLRDVVLLAVQVYLEQRRGGHKGGSS